MKRIVIGIPLTINNDKNKKRYKIYSRYEEYLYHFNISAVYLTPLNSSYLLPYLDGVLFCGGDDVNPRLYSKIDCSDICIDDYQDTFELSLLKKCRLLKKPIFGICRGLQLINIYFKGTLKNICNHQNKDHKCQIVNYQTPNEIYITTNSYHHQCIDRLGEGLSTYLKSEDGCIEGIIDEKRMILAVQYHPEITFDSFFIEKMLDLLN